MTLHDDMTLDWTWPLVVCKHSDNLWSGQHIGVYITDWVYPQEIIARSCIRSLLYILIPFTCESEQWLVNYCNEYGW